MLSRRALCGLMGAAALAGPRPARARAGSPPRIASMDYALTETLLWLGVPPIAMPDGQGWNDWVIDPPLPPSVENLGSDQEPNLELLASLRPELIVTTPYLDALTPLLSRIAPCERLAIYEEGGAGPLARAEGVTLRLAALIGEPARGEEVLAQSRAAFAADRDRLAAHAPKPLLMVNLIDPRHVRVYGAKSLWQDVLDRLGWPNAWTQPTTYWGFATVGIEELASAPADAMLVLSRPVPPDAVPTLARSPLWRSLPFVRDERVLELAPALMFGGVPAALRFAGLLTDAIRARSPS